MLRSVHALVWPALQARVVLLVNHVLSREPVAAERLKAHAGRRVRIEAQGTPGWLPAPPAAAVCVTPAGLFEVDESAGSADEADLRLSVAAPDLGQLLAAVGGQARPQVQIDGDAALAADMHWLVDNLRWDVEADLAEAIGAAPAHQLVGVGRSVAAALRALAPAAGADRR